MSRHYTVAEIDDLRRVIENKFLFGCYKRPQSTWSRSYNEIDKLRYVEEVVRTHMLAGHTAQDLLDSEAESAP